MKKELREKCEAWSAKYSELVRPNLPGQFKSYGLGVMDGVANTAIPAFMAGCKTALNTLVRKVGYENAPRPNTRILAICNGNDKCKDNMYVGVCYVDKDRNLVGGGIEQALMTHWIEIDDLCEYLMEGIR